MKSTKGSWKKSRDRKGWLTLKLKSYIASCWKNRSKKGMKS